MKRTSLRELAASLGCTHSSLSEAVHAGRLVAGFRIERGRVVVVDATAAAREWRDVYRQRIDDMCRRENARERGVGALFIDPDNGYDWTGPALLRAARAHSLLSLVLVSVAFEALGEDELRARVVARVRDRAQRRHAEPLVVAEHAERIFDMDVRAVVDPEEFDFDYRDDNEETEEKT